MPQVCFEHADSELFSEASYDKNPLHLSTDYSRRTIYGEPIVHGILGGLAAMSCLPPRPGATLTKASMTFHGPLQHGVAYNVASSEIDPNSVKLILADGDRTLLTTKLTFRRGPQDVPLKAAGQCQRQRPAAWRYEELCAGMEATGRYAPLAGPLAAITQRWQLADKGVAPAQLGIFLLASYLVGMELPGERAVFSRLRIEFHPLPIDDSLAIQPLEYSARAVDFDERFDLLEIRAAVEWGNSAVAEAALWSQTRRDPPALSVAELARLLPTSERLVSKTALVTGGSRGLGAAIVAALGSQGCRVLANCRCAADDSDTAPVIAPQAPDGVEWVPGDASNLKWCGELRDAFLARGARIDILVCNASPPIRPLARSTETEQRMRRFVDQSLSLVTAPMSALLPLVNARAGSAVLISSDYVRTQPADFSHYVAAKVAAEAFVQAVSKSYPATRFLIVRPPRLLTGQTNTPTGRAGALRVEAIAAAIVSRVVWGEPGKLVDFLEDFA